LCSGNGFVVTRHRQSHGITVTATGFAMFLKIRVAVLARQESQIINQTEGIEHPMSALTGSPVN
jgi:hypothetical protein